MTPEEQDRLLKLPRYEIAALDLGRASVMAVEHGSHAVWLPITSKFIRVSDLLDLLDLPERPEVGT